MFLALAITNIQRDSNIFKLKYINMCANKFIRENLINLVPNPLLSSF